MQEVVKCPRCQRSLRLAAGTHGQRVRCSACQDSFIYSSARVEFSGRFLTEEQMPSQRPTSMVADEPAVKSTLPTGGDDDQTPDPWLLKYGPGTQLCRAVNGLAILSYLGLIAWGLIGTYPGGLVLAFFAPLELLPYLLAIRTAKTYSCRPIAATLLLLASLLSALVGLALDYVAVILVHHDFAVIAAGPDGTSCGPPVTLIVAIWLVLMAGLQFGFIGGAMFLAYLLRLVGLERQSSETRLADVGAD